jgi:inhibitor of cysteine peptidase
VKNFLSASVVIVCAVLICAAIPVHRKTVTITDKDMNKFVRLNVGQTVILSLDGNPSTGYNWKITAKDKRILRQIGGASFTPASNAIGAGGKVKFEFKVVGFGRTTLSLAYLRPWDINVPPVKRFNVDLIVK